MFCSLLLFLFLFFRLRFGLRLRFGHWRLMMMKFSSPLGDTVKAQWVRSLASEVLIWNL